MDSLTETAKHLYRVKVDCWYDFVSNNKRAAVRKRISRQVLVEGSCADEAIRAAVAWGESTALVGQRLVGVEHRECSGPVKFPLEILT